jgi:hypothetical protein
MPLSRAPDGNCYGVGNLEHETFDAWHLREVHDKQPSRPASGDQVIDRHDLTQRAEVTQPVTRPNLTRAHNELSPAIEGLNPRHRRSAAAAPAAIGPKLGPHDKLLRKAITIRLLIPRTHGNRVHKSIGAIARQKYRIFRDV